MKKLIVAALAGAFVATPALAGSDVAAHCEAYVAEHGGDASMCPCLAEKAAKDEAFKAAILAISAPADYEVASEETKAVVATCMPPAPAPAQ